LKESELVSNTHALIIDDKQANIQVLAILLENEGVTSTSVESARNVPAALATLPKVDVIFLDLEFPNGDGFEILGVLEATPALHGVPIVAYTVHTSEIDEVRRAGFHSFLGKPISAAQFPEQLRRILNGEHVWEV
jgi:two-component system cell cycle response regulator DivK